MYYDKLQNWFEPALLGKLSKKVTGQRFQKQIATDVRRYKTMDENTVKKNPSGLSFPRIIIIWHMLKILCPRVDSLRGCALKVFPSFAMSILYTLISVKN